jgi:acyl-CoA synthetase (AMP-forming)/AMP-acid ligase II
LQALSTCEGRRHLSSCSIASRHDDLRCFDIYPAELENAITVHPAVIDPRWRETPRAVICVKPQSSVTEMELIELCAVHLGNYKRPGDCT